MTPTLDEARRLVADAREVAALTGAGVSAESGIPTFRGDGGLWENHRPEELATPEAFARDPELVWRFYRWRRQVVLEANPNAGHEALARYGARRALTLITQNVDGLHRRAGSRDVVELHGCLLASRCQECGGAVAMEEEPQGDVPRCRRCPGLLRPDVVWFGESLPPAAWEQAFAAAERCDLFLLLGTSAVVHPAAGLAVRAIERGVPVIEVNPEQTVLSEAVTIRLQAGSAVVLPDLLAT